MICLQNSSLTVVGNSRSLFSHSVRVSSAESSLRGVIQNSSPQDALFISLVCSTHVSRGIVALHFKLIACETRFGTGEKWHREFVPSSPRGRDSASFKHVFSFSSDYYPKSQNLAFRSPADSLTTAFFSDSTGKGASCRMSERATSEAMNSHRPPIETISNECFFFIKRNHRSPIRRQSIIARLLFYYAGVRILYEIYKLAINFRDSWRRRHASMQFLHHTCVVDPRFVYTYIYFFLMRR